MNTTVAPAPWSRPAGTAPTAWRFGRPVGSETGGDSGGDGVPRIEWLLKRNCSITPRQLFGVYLSLCALSLVIALSFTWAGASPVLAFAGVELVLVGLALLVYARHATDHERITLAGEALSVEHQHGPQTARTEFRAAWVRVEPLSSDRSLIEVAGDGHTACVGRYVRAELRQPLAQELRAALRAHRVLVAQECNEHTAIKK
jgi:uncharacterized membrane protein